MNINPLFAADSAKTSNFLKLSTLHPGLVIMWTQPARWSSPSATPRRKADSSSWFTPAGRHSVYMSVFSVEFPTLRSQCQCALLFPGFNFTPPEPWRPAPRTAPTLTCPLCYCRTRRPPPRGGPPPRRGISTQSSTRGEPSWRAKPTRGGAGSFFIYLFIFSNNASTSGPQVRLWFHSGGVDPEEAGPLGEEQRVLHEQREGAHREGKTSAAPPLHTHTWWY